MFLAPALTRRLSATARPQSPIHRLPAALRRTLLAAGCLAALLVPAAARAQNPGDLDTSFTSTIGDATFYAFTFEEINNVQYAFIGGDSGISARFLTKDGSFDPAFTPTAFGFPNQRIIYTAVPEQLGDNPPKILIGGLFGRNAAQVAAVEPGQNIKRFLPADGTIDTTFNPGSGANNYVTSILPLVDGTNGGPNSGDMIVAGEFDEFNKVPHLRIVKLDNTGAIVDNSVFSSSLAFDATVLSLAQQYVVNNIPNTPGTLNGQILVAGAFGNVNGKVHTKLARINADGSVDDAFNPVFSDRVRIVISQPDGKILAGGDFETVNGQAVKHLVRLNFDGSLDTSFRALATTMPTGIDAPVAVNTITPLGDGRYYIGGNFYAINGVPRHYLGRVLADGTVDDFDPGTNITNSVQQVAIDPVTNKVFVTQNRDKSVNGTFPPSVLRLYGDPVPLPSVSIGATIPTSTLAQRGEFTITRATNDNSAALRVYFLRGGTAKNKGPAIVVGETTVPRKGDYALKPTPTKDVGLDGQTDFFVDIPAGSDSVVITVRETKTAHLGRTVTLTLEGDQSGINPYTVTAASEATVTLN